MRNGSRLRLIHWNPAEAAGHIASLRKAGHRVEYSPEFTSSLLREWRADPPDAFVIDLSRLPSHGREIAVALRQSKLTRGVPIVFCGGAEDKIAKTRSLLPDAAFCKSDKLASAIQAAVRSASQSPVVPAAMMDRYAGRTVAQKLGIREGSSVLLIDGPREMPNALGELPPSVTFVETADENPAVTLCFVDDPDDLYQQLSDLRSLAKQTKLWICWKKGKSASGGVSEPLVRETGITLGLVDYKICAVSPIWSGMLFAAKSARKK